MVSAALVTIIVVAVIVVIVIIVLAITLSNNQSVSPTPPPPPPVFVCTGTGLKPSTPIPIYARLTPLTTATSGPSNANPEFNTVNHPVQKLDYLRSLSYPVSPNHWFGNQMYESGSVFNCYPYIGRITPLSLQFSYPLTGSVIDNSDIFYNADYTSLAIIQTVITSRITAVDYVNIDALTATIIWSTQNTQNLTPGTITTYLAKGCPFITNAFYNVDIQWRVDFTASLNYYISSYFWLLEIDSTTGYLFVFSTPVTPTYEAQTLSLNYFTGTVRIAYYTSENFQSLIDYHKIYPVAATIGLDRFNWEVKQVHQMTSESNDLLMLALPHHQITNQSGNHGMMGNGMISPARLITTTDYSWILTIENNPIPSYTNLNNAQLASIWNKDMLDLPNRNPQNTTDWFKWLGSIAQVIMIGISQGYDVTTLKNTLLSNVSKTNNLVYDKTWNGVIVNSGLTTCSGLTDSGNSFYESSIGQIGYLLYAMAVACQVDTGFRNANMNLALQYYQTVMNYYGGDSSYPLWRNKDVYYGFSISSGLRPDQEGKMTENVGPVIFGYYGGLILAQIVNDSDMIAWSNWLLNTEINSLKEYFQFSGSNFVPHFNESFKQGTISQLGDTLYNYNMLGGDPTYPARNASIIMSVIQPFSLVSSPYINKNWVTMLQSFLEAAINAGVSLDAGAYALGLLAVNASDSDKEDIMTQLVKYSPMNLNYGSSWSSIAYWVLAQA